MGDFEKAINALEDLPKDRSPSAKERKEIAALRLEAELAGRDFDSAYSTAIKELEESNDAELATQSALIALETGADRMPDSAREILVESESDELEALESIYSINEPDLLNEDSDLEELNEMLKRIESSEQAILEVLENG